jgi:hypothetical protein
MIHRETVIRVPHAVNVRRVDGKKEGEVLDPRVSVTIKDRGCELVLFFENLDPSSPLLELRLLPGPTAFEPWRFVPQLPLYLSYARAAMGLEREDTAAALRALRQAGSGRRGLSDDFLKIVAEMYKAFVADGEPYPIKAIAGTQSVSHSGAWRWVNEARRRGFLLEEDQQ